MSRIYTASDVSTPYAGAAWTDAGGLTLSAVHIGVGTYFTFSSPEDAEALSAACLEAAEAHRRQQAEHEQAKGNSTEGESTDG
jgi:hypothetical protein